MLPADVSYERKGIFCFPFGVLLLQKSKQCTKKVDVLLGPISFELQGEREDYDLMDKVWYYVVHFLVSFCHTRKKGLKDCPEGGGDSRNAPLLRITAKKKPFRGWQKILTLPIFWGTKYLQMDPIHLLNWHKYQARKLFSRPKWGCFLAYNFRQVPPLQSVAKYIHFFSTPIP